MVLLCFYSLQTTHNFRIACPLKSSCSLLEGSEVIFWVFEPSQVLCSICHCPLTWLLTEMPPIATDTQVASAIAMPVKLILSTVLKASLSLQCFWDGNEDCNSEQKCIKQSAPATCCYSKGIAKALLLELFHVPAVSLKRDSALHPSWCCAIMQPTRLQLLVCVTELLFVNQLFTVASSS